MLNFFTTSLVERFMNIFIKAVLVILVLLAISSGITKIFLMPQDVEFFGKYGFTNPILIVYGAVQIIGGVLLILKKQGLLVRLL